MPVLVPAAGQQLAVNGVDLSQYAVILDSLAPLMRAPAKRGKNIVLPGRHGTYRLPNKPFDEADITLRLLVLGAQPDGTVPSGSTAAKELYARADALMALLPAGDTVTLTRTMPDGTQRRAVAEVIDRVDWTRRLGDRPLIAEVAVALTLPDAFWYEPTTTTVGTTGGGVTTGGSFSVSGLASTAPIVDPVITFGPGSNPTLVQGGTFLAYDGVISSGRQLVVDCSSWQLGYGSGSVWTPDITAIRYGPGPYWFPIDPTATPLSLSLTHTGGGSMTVSITANRRFLTA